MNKYQISEGLLKAIVGYFYKQPYEQVVSLLNEIDKEVRESKAPAEEKKA
jgi:hypothetical protein